MVDDDLERRLRDSGVQLGQRPLPASLRSRLLAVPASTVRPRSRRRSELVMALATATAFAAVLVAALASRHGPVTSPSGGPWHVSFRALVNGGPNGALGAADGSAWLTTRGQTRLYRVDAPLGVVTLAAQPGAALQGGGFPSADSAVLVTSDSIWVATTNHLLRLDRVSGRVLATLPISDVGPTHALISDGGAIWAASGDTGTVYRIDRLTGQIVATIPVAPSAAVNPDQRNPAGLAAIDGLVWVASEGSSGLVGIDPRTNRVSRDLALPHPPSDLVAGQGSLWVASSSAGVVDRIDAATGRVVRSIVVDRPVALTGTVDSVWVASGNAVARIDPLTDRVAARVDVGGSVFALAGDGDSVWVASGPEPYVSRIVRGD